MSRFPSVVGSCLLAVAACACGSRSATTGSQPLDVTGCTQPAPSYAKDVAPLLDRDCNRTCHAPGVGPWPLTDWADVAAWADAIDSDLRNGTMPPQDAGTLPAADKAPILDWLACGAPDN